MTSEEMPIKFFSIGRQRGYMLLIGRARFILNFGLNTETWTQRGDDGDMVVSSVGKIVQPISPLQILMELGTDPWHYPLTTEDRVRYEERGDDTKMERPTESGSTE